MEFLKFCVDLALYLSISFYIYWALVLTITVSFDGIERMVNWLGNKISANRTAKSLR